jgi:hypothetical protein
LPPPPSYKWGFNWGGRYVKMPDPMHFEIAVTPTGAIQLAHDLRTLAGRPPAYARPEEELLVDIFSSPAAEDDEVVCHGKDGALWHKSGGGAWVRIGGGIAKGSSPAISRFNRVETRDGVPVTIHGYKVVVTGLDGQFWKIEKTAAGWGAWRKIGGAAAFVPV